MDLITSQEKETQMVAFLNMQVIVEFWLIILHNLMLKVLAYLQIHPCSCPRRERKIAQAWADKLAIWVLPANL